MVRRSLLKLPPSTGSRTLRIHDITLANVAKLTALLGISITSKAAPVQTPTLANVGTNAPVAVSSATAKAGAGQAKGSKGATAASASASAAEATATATAIATPATGGGGGAAAAGGRGKGDGGRNNNDKRDTRLKWSKRMVDVASEE